MVNLNGIELKNRFIVSAGALSYGEGYFWQKPLIRAKLIDPAAFGGVTTRTLTLEPREGNFIGPMLPSSFPERVRYYFRMIGAKKNVLRKIPGGWINNFAWWNVGIDCYVREIYPKTRGLSQIVSVGGFVIDDFTEVIRKLNSLNVAALELNISCVNVGRYFTGNHSELVKLFTFCRAASRHPLIVKLGSESDFIGVAKIAEYCGINALSAINTVSGLIIKKGEHFRGGISGQTIKPIALRIIAALKQAGISLPVIGGGGIYSWRDCLDFFQAGADAVSFGSIFLEWHRFWLPTHIVRSRKKYNPR